MEKLHKMAQKNKQEHGKKFSIVQSAKYYVEFDNNNNNEKFLVLFPGWQTGESFCWSFLYHEDKGL